MLFLRPLITCTLYSVHMSSFSASAKATAFSHHNQLFGVIFEKSDFDIKNLIVIQKARGRLEALRLNVFTG